MRGRSLLTATIMVHYTLDGRKLTHGLHNNMVRLAPVPESLTLHAIRAELFDNDEESPEPGGLLTNKLWYYHHYADASNDLRSVTGGVGMLAGGCIMSFSQIQHLVALDSHTSEVV